MHGAAAKTVPLNWHETFRVEGRPLIEFTVVSLQFGNGKWSVRASFTNRSSGRLRIVRNNFALAAYPSPKANPCRFLQLRAARFMPRLPSSIPRGSTWTGTFGGSGWPPKPRHVRVVFANFAAKPTPYPNLDSFGWITDHVYSIASGRSTLSSGLNCP